MGKVYTVLDERLQTWIGKQHMYFVATAPLSGDGRVNLSPKGLDSFAILDETTVAYLDLVGSGAETLAHLRENGRITLLFCAFEGPPNLVRLYGKGEGIEPGDSEFDELAAHFPSHGGTRAIIRVKLDRISDSCGYGVPLYEFKENRKQMHAWAERKGEDALRDYQLENNTESIDGLPALRATTLKDGFNE